MPKVVDRRSDPLVYLALQFCKKGNDRGLSAQEKSRKYAINDVYKWPINVHFTKVQSQRFFCVFYVQH